MAPAFIPIVLAIDKFILQVKILKDIYYEGLSQQTNGLPQSFSFYSDPFFSIKKQNVILSAGRWISGPYAWHKSHPLTPFLRQNWVMMIYYLPDGTALSFKYALQNSLTLTCYHD